MKKLLTVLVLILTVTGIYAQTQYYEGGVQYKKRRGTGKVEIIPNTNSTIEFNDGVTISSNGTELKVLVGDVEKLVVNGNQTYVLPLSGAKVGRDSSWSVNAANDSCLVQLPASQTNASLIVPVNYPLKVGSTITGFSLAGQVESAGNTVTLTAQLRKHTAAAADVTDALVDSLDTNVSVTADAILSATNAVSSGLTEVVAAGETFYFVIKATTGASTDIALQGINLTVKE